MNKIQKEYMDSLITWVEQVDHLVDQQNMTEEWYQWTIWKDKVRQMASDRSFTLSDLIQVKVEAETYYQLIQDRQSQSSVHPGTHRLPPLPYAYDGLEPYISEEIVRLHYQKHHQSYVDGLNRAEIALANENEYDTTMFKHWLREQAFNGSGHYLHTIYWNNMTPNHDHHIVKDTAVSRQIIQDFGSIQKFQRTFTKAAQSVEGSGWVILAWDPTARRLIITSLEKHQHFALANVIPLLVIDLWEHAYYLQYKTGRDKYIEAWWNIVNWHNVDMRFLRAKELKWAPF